MPLGTPFYVLIQSKAYEKSFVHFAHDTVIQTANLFSQPLLVNGSHLFKQNNRIFDQCILLAVYLNVGRKLGLVDLACYGRAYDSRAVAVANIVLDNQHWPDASLLRADHRAKIRVKYIASLYQHFVSLSVFAAIAVRDF
jgi:hypothetical protein